MKYVIRFASACALVAAVAANAQADTLTIATEGAYPPFNFIDDAGNVAGYEREFGDEACKRAGLTCEWVTNDWDSIIPNLVSSNYDAIMAGMNISEERKKAIQFSEPYTPPPLSAYAALSADAPIDGVVSAQVNTIQAGFVAESGATLTEFATGEETIAAVRNGEAKTVFADKDFLAPYVKESNGELVWVDGQDKVVVGEGIAIGMRQSDAELKGKFDAAIKSMKDDGSLNTMIKKWFGDEALVF